MKLQIPQILKLEVIFDTVKFSLKNLFRHLLIFCVLFFQQINICLASENLPITPDGTTNTIIDKAPNGITVINIAPTDPNGISNNRYEDLNVNDSGAIFNNATRSVNGAVMTGLGGIISDNPNLATSGSASIILNEVTSNNITQINGAIEIAGKKAELIIANPNGIMMNGAGFINTSRFTAVVGSTNQYNPNSTELTFNLNRNAYALTNGFLPELTIMGKGVGLEEVTSTDFVANIMKIVAPIYAGDNDVNLRSGDKTFNYYTKEISSDNLNSSSAKSNCN